MKRRLTIFLVLVMLIFPLNNAFADDGLDDQGNPNDPKVNDRANACYPGGAMEGKCDIEWEWTCGWYLIRYTSGLLARNKVPATCGSLLPPLPPMPTKSGCMLAMTAPQTYYAYFNGGNYIPSPVPLYADPGCTNQIDETSAMVYTLNGATAALAICQSYDSDVDFALSDIGYGPLPAGIYICYID